MSSFPNVPSNLQAGLTWPIQVQGAVQRFSPYGDPTIETYYHKAMEQGRFLETSIGDANNWLLQKKQQLLYHIKLLTHMNSLAVDGQLGHTPRVPKYIADSENILQTVNQFLTEIQQLVAAITQNVALLAQMEANMIHMLQANLNALANLLNNICNWGLPALLSIPQSLPEQIWNWNGFGFAPLAQFTLSNFSQTTKVVGSLAQSIATGSIATPVMAAVAPLSNPQFDQQFQFSHCTLNPTNNLTQAATSSPTSVSTYTGLNFGTSSDGTTLYIPPLAGTSTPPTQNLTDPTFVSTMQGQTTPPVYGPTFNPSTSMIGSVPDPHTIIDNYQMPASVFINNIIAICPQLTNNTIEPSAPDYANPNYAVRNPQERKAFVHFITLADIVENNFDPFMLSAWLLYLNADRQARGGAWIPNFEVVYQQYIQPSVDYLTATPCPWNNVLGMSNLLYQSIWSNTQTYQINDVVTYNGTLYIANLQNVNSEPDLLESWTVATAPLVYSNAPTLPLVTTFLSLSESDLNILLWQLSYIEASILGYSRNSQWDTTQNTTYLSGPTGPDLDYKPTSVSSTQTSLVLGQGTAEFPVTIVFPTSIKNTLTAVIDLATINIQNDPNYLSPRLGNRFTYNQFAQATMVDRYSQFWRDFASNLSSLLVQDPYLVQFTVTYVEILDGAVDPLSGFTAAYTALQQDVASRNRSWTPGTPLLSLPIAPVVTYSSTATPTGSGWTGVDFDPTVFLARPDVQSQTLPVQMAMLRTNVSYASLQQFQNEFQQEIMNQMATAASVVAQLSAGQISGTSISGGVLTVVTSNTFTAGDNVELMGTQEAYLNNQTVTVTSASSTQFTATPPAGSPPSLDNPSDTGLAWQATPSQAYQGDALPFTASNPLPAWVGANIPALTPVRVRVQSGGNISPIDVFIATIANIAIASNVLTVTFTAAGHHFVNGENVTFDGLESATFLNGTTASNITVVSSTQITVGYSHADYASTPDSGSVLLLDPFGQIAAPFPDGLAVSGPTAPGTNAEVVLEYGTIYTVPTANDPLTGQPFVVGGLLYALPVGAPGNYAVGLTQDYNALIALGTAGWVVCIGKVIELPLPSVPPPSPPAIPAQAGQMAFLYEPHIPTRLTAL